MYVFYILCVSFLSSAGMYLWGDFPHVTLATAWFEFVFYVICFWEAVFCMLMWWADFKQRDGADGAYACYGN